MQQGNAQGQQLAITANLIAVQLSEFLSLDDQNIVGNLLALTGASLLSIAAVGAARSSNEDPSAASSTSSTGSNSSATTSASGSDTSGSDKQAGV
ncbi:MAG TPA: hypothetical protein VHR42_09250 [Clostridia bacterium]|nr:hypothetical protein [Clostridia bacterium]